MYTLFDVSFLWGLPSSRLSSWRLQRQTHILGLISSYQHAYWPTDRPVPNVFDFGMIKGSPGIMYKFEDSMQLSSINSAAIV